MHRLTAWNLTKPPGRTLMLHRWCSISLWGILRLANYIPTVSNLQSLYSLIWQKSSWTYVCIIHSVASEAPLSLFSGFVPVFLWTALLGKGAGHMWKPVQSCKAECCLLFTTQGFPFAWLDLGWYKGIWWETIFKHDTSLNLTNLVVMTKMK